MLPFEEKRSDTVPGWDASVILGDGDRQCQIRGSEADSDQVIDRNVILGKCLILGKSLWHTCPIAAWSHSEAPVEEGDGPPDPPSFAASSIGVPRLP